MTVCVVSRETGEESYKLWVLPAVNGQLLPGCGHEKKEAEAFIKPPTAQEIEALHRQAYEEGFALGKREGLAQGYAEGKNNAFKEYQERSDVLRKIIEFLHNPVSGVDAEMENSVAELAILIAKHLVRRELKSNPGEIVGVVREAMKHLPISARNPKIHLNPDDVEVVQEALAIGEGENIWRLEPDPLLSRGGCLVESQSSFIDATVESRLAAIISKLLGGERESDRSA